VEGAFGRKYGKGDIVGCGVDCQSEGLFLYLQ
jgi:hypothetical protein